MTIKKKRKRKKERIFKGILDWFVWKAFRLSVFIVQKLNLETIHFIGKKLGDFVFYSPNPRKNVVLKNLRMAYGREKSEKELKGICRGCFQNFGMNILETIRYAFFSFEEIDNFIAIDGKEHLDNALKKGKGVIALSAHLGNFPIIASKFIPSGYQFSLIFRSPENPNINKEYLTIMRKFGLNPIFDKPRHVCVKKSLELLKKNGILFLQIDQNTKVSRGVYVRFFNHELPTFTGPVVLAIRTGAVVLPLFIVREENSRHRIIIDKPFELVLTGERNFDIKNNTERLSKITEGYIRMFPEQWWWIHKRWKKAKEIVN
ncbi:MAG: lysophospholipid acyltransferase family protein [Thermodesulfobacteriota bacterium]|nr:lysophospholipid acyltransferase family protein [Thermodesulfobacteriota bacterium]